VCRALFAGLIDYSGLFPPATLTMEAAVAEYAKVRRGRHAWILHRFVVPADRLIELDAAVASLEEPSAAGGPWPVSVLLGADPARDLVRVADVSARLEKAGMLNVEALETRVYGTDTVRHVSASADVRRDAATDWSREIWFEVTPGAGLGSALAEIASVRGGAKLRTGGLERTSIPTPSDVARVLLGCVHADIRFKATAGLHHAMRGSHALTATASGEEAVQHGFVNVFLAAVLARQVVRDRHPAPEAEAQVTALVEEQDSAELRWNEDEVEWRGYRFGAADIRQCRARLARSFGSCSFEEPVDDMGALGLL
jgi:hypothetical protein